MTMTPNDDRRAKQGLSRRDFVLGRLLRQGSPDGTNGPGTAATTSGAPPTMRYPKSLQDVSESGSQHSAGSVPQSDYTARRRTIPLFRPPGAIDEPSFLAGCTRCELCIEACPHDTIIKAPQQLREAAATPTILADHQPCLMCQDFPCIAACEPKVLSPLVPIRMGTAKITEQLCLPHQGVACTECVEQCPVESAIEIRDGKPSIVEERCTGCGVCRFVCPAPENAVLLMPMFLRPAASGEEKCPHE